MMQSTSSDDSVLPLDFIPYLGYGYRREIDEMVKKEEIKMVIKKVSTYFLLHLLFTKSFKEGIEPTIKAKL